MARVMAVAFGPHARLHYLDPGDADYAHGQAVLVPTEHGPEVARCVWAPTEVDADLRLPRCGGAASDVELARDEAGRVRREEIRRVAVELIARHRLPMTVVGVDHVEDGESGRVAVVYFKAPHRVDFRGLLSDLARALASRIDLRQVGNRDLAALTGGIGPCGRELCCCALCPPTEPASPRIGADQEAANAALKLVGTCGRLKCCLAYEADAYASFVARAPGIGAVVADADAGEGVVSGYAVPADAVWVRTADGVRAVALDALTVVHPAPEPARPSAAAPAEADAEPPADRQRRRFLRRDRPRRES